MESERRPPRVFCRRNWIPCFVAFYVCRESYQVEKTVIMKGHALFLHTVSQSYTNKRVLCLMDILIHNFIKSFKRLRLNTLRKNNLFKHLLFLNATQLQPTELAYIVIVSKYSLEVGCASSTSILRVDPQKYPNIQHSINEN